MVPALRVLPVCAPSGVAGGGVLGAGGAGTAGVARGVTGDPSEVTGGVLLTTGSFEESVRCAGAAVGPAV